MDLNATEEQLDSPVVYCSGRAGTATYAPEVPGKDLRPLFDKILEHIDPPEGCLLYTSLAPFHRRWIPEPHRRSAAFHP